MSAWVLFEMVVILVVVGYALFLVNGVRSMERNYREGLVSPGLRKRGWLLVGLDVAWMSAALLVVALI